MTEKPPTGNPTPPPAAITTTVPPRASAEPADERVSEVIGERICTCCGFNLFGQPIVRERHYALLIVRCPECGTVASLQEYPLLGKWANRWGRFFAALWIFAVFILILISASIIVNFSSNTATQILQPTAVTIGKDFQAWMRANPEKYDVSDGPNSYIYDPGGDIRRATTDAAIAQAGLDTEWWVDHGQAEIRAEFATLTPRYDWTALIGNFGWLAIWLIFLGLLWSIITPMKSILTVVMLLLLIFGFATIGLITTTEFASIGFNWWESAQELALQEFGLPPKLVAVGVSLIPVGIAMLFGRILARWTVIAFLPPRMRGWVAFLWIVDGKTPPKKTWLDR